MSDGGRFTFWYRRKGTSSFNAPSPVDPPVMSGANTVTWRGEALQWRGEDLTWR